MDNLVDNPDFPVDIPVDNVVITVDNALTRYATHPQNVCTHAQAQLNL